MLRPEVLLDGERLKRVELQDRSSISSHRANAWIADALIQVSTQKAWQQWSMEAG